MNIVELHTNKCIMNCVWCEQGTSRELTNSSLDNNVAESFKLLQATLNTHNTDVHLQYNLPIDTLQNLHLSHLRPELLYTLWFALRLNADKPIDQYLNQLSALLASEKVNLNYTDLSLLLMPNNVNISDQEISYITQFISTYHQWQQKNYPHLSSSISLMKNMSTTWKSQNSNITIRREKTKLLDQLETCDLNTAIKSNTFQINDKIYDEKKPFFSEKWFEIEVWENLLFQRKYIITNFLKITENIRNQIRDLFLQVAITDCLQEYISSIALYPHEVRVGHDARSVRWWKEYFTVTHEQFQKFLSMVTERNIKTYKNTETRYIDFSPLVRENLLHNYEIDINKFKQ